MRFSTIAAAATFIGMVVAIPHEVVYETQIITITSCAPEKPNCPYATHTSTTVAPVVETTTCTDEIEVPHSTHIYEHPHGPSNNTHPGNNTVPHPTYPHPTWSVTAGLPTDVPSGVPVPPAQNTTVPLPPNIPPPSEGAATKMGASFVAVMGAAALVLML